MFNIVGESLAERVDERPFFLGGSADCVGGFGKGKRLVIICKIAWCACFT
jgi:hypothetical protein